MGEALSSVGQVPLALEPEGRRRARESRGVEIGRQPLQTVEASPSVHQACFTAPDRTVVSGAAWPSKMTVSSRISGCSGRPASPGTCSSCRSRSSHVDLGRLGGLLDPKVVRGEQAKSKNRGRIGWRPRASTPHQAIAGHGFLPLLDPVAVYGDRSEEERADDRGHPASVLGLVQMRRLMAGWSSPASMAETGDGACRAGPPPPWWDRSGTGGTSRSTWPQASRPAERRPWGRSAPGRAGRRSRRKGQSER